MSIILLADDRPSRSSAWVSVSYAKRVMQLVKSHGRAKTRHSGGWVYVDPGTWSIADVFSARARSGLEPVPAYQGQNSVTCVWC